MNLNRRQFLSAAALAFAGCATAARREGLRLGVQMWSVNDLWKKDPADAFRRLRALGYEGVQSLGFLDMKWKDLEKMLDDNGLAIVDMPFRIDFLEGNANKYLEFCDAFDVDFIFDPWEKFATATEWRRLADRLSALADRFRPHGIRVGYHNHQHEFRQHFEGVTPMEILAAAPKVDFELDVGHAKLAAADPVAWLERLGTRVPSIHAKPGGGDSVGGKGDANDWKSILSVCRANRVRWAVVECETRRNTYEDVTASRNYLSNLL